MRYTIITINLNNKDGLKKTIESVINQTFKDFEYIIIDGGSTDGSLDVINEYNDKIDFWCSEPDKGVYNAMNKGILHAKGDYLNFMNSGDSFYVDGILDSLKNYNEDIFYGDIVRSDICKRVKFHEINSFYQLCIGDFNHQAMFFNKRLFLKRMYDESYKIMADRKFIIESILFDNITIKYIKIIISNYECGGISSNKQLGDKEHDLILKELLPPLIYNDYIVWSKFKLPILYNLSFIINKYRIQYFINIIIVLIIRLFRLEKK